MNTKTKYAARATKAQKWTVARWTGFEWKPLGDVQWFDSFENADECAREIAAGKYEQWTAGEYVSLR